MKKLILICLCTIFILNLDAQTSNDSVSVKKNSVAVNVNGLLSYVFNGNYNSDAMLTYRRHFRKWNLRVGLGAYVSNNDRLTDVNTVNNYHYTAINFRTGVEFPVLRYNNWQAYIGGDAVGAYNTNSQERDYDNGVRELRESMTVSAGMSALCGINYQLNSLLSFGAETNYDILLSQGETKISYSTGGWTYDTDYEDYRGISASYSSPIRLNIRIHF